jgi:tetratricopeptide (TPR) repeat protein
MKNPFAKFEALYKAAEHDEEFDKALSEIAKIEQDHELAPNILVSKGDCIQLGSGSVYVLSDAEAAYKRALEIDPEHIEAHIELGFFYLNIMNEGDKALPYFENALSLARSKITQAVEGMATCLSETKSPREALDFIERAIENTIDKDKINKTIESIGKSSR